MKTLPIALAVSAIFVIAGCSSSSSGSGAATSSSPTAAPQATDAASKEAATAQIKANWATFLNSNTPQATAVGLLQNGANLGPAIAVAAKVAKKEKTTETAKVSSVTFTSPTNANVTYDLIGNGKVLLKNSQGKAVLDDGVWKVSSITFCTLADLGAETIGLKNAPGC
jgi:hypothetical protein